MPAKHLEEPGGQKVFDEGAVKLMEPQLHAGMPMLPRDHKTKSNLKVTQVFCLHFSHTTISNSCFDFYYWQCEMHSTSHTSLSSFSHYCSHMPHPPPASQILLPLAVSIPSSLPLIFISRMACRAGPLPQRMRGGWGLGET